MVQRLQTHLPRFLQERPGHVDEDGARGPVARIVGDFAERHARVLVGIGVVLTIAACIKLPRSIADPWEYDFDKLGSKGSRTSGPAIWSKNAEMILGGKANISGSLVLADRPDQVPLVKAKILANDAADAKGSLIEGITTLDEYLPGSPELQKKKLEVLDRIRDRLLERVLES